MRKPVCATPSLPSALKVGSPHRQIEQANDGNANARDSPATQFLIATFMSAPDRKQGIESVRRFVEPAVRARIARARWWGARWSSSQASVSRGGAAAARGRRGGEKGGGGPPGGREGRAHAGV